MRVGQRRVLIAGLSSAAVVAAGLMPALSTPAWATTANPAPSAGARENATRLNFTLSGTASLSVDVATGNAMVTDQLLSLPGINKDVSVAVAFNSSAVGTAMPSTLGAAGNGWEFSGFDQRLVANADSSVTYYGPGGLTGVFTPVAGSSPTTYTQPSEFQGDLAAVAAGGWTLRMHQSQDILSFDSSGRLAAINDKNSNITSFTYDASHNPTSIVSSRGGGTGSAATSTTTGAVTTTSGRVTGIGETVGALARSVVIGYDTSNRVQTVRDTQGNTTTFGYGTGTASSPTNQVVSISNPDGEQTTLAYSGAKVTQVSQTNTATGSPGTSVTRLSYPSSTQTLVADPTTNQSQAVSAVPHTTFALDSATTLVASATDPDGDAQSATYNPQNNTTLTQTSAAGGQSSYTYGSNSGESLTAAASPGGATATASYGNAAGSSSQYAPSSTTNSAGNQLSLSYDGNGNATSSAQAGVSAVLDYTGNTHGQPTSSRSPGAASTVKTSYGYDATTHDLTSITPVSGTSLGSRAFTWDGFGRLATATDGRGNTITYTYTKADEIKKVDYSDAGTTDVSYTYDAEDRPTQRIDGSGTTTWTYDDLGRMTSMVNTAGGGTETYRYDLAGMLASKTDTSGTTSYTYSRGHRVVSMSYPQGSGGNLITQFKYDSGGRRSDVWMQTDGALDGSGNAAPGKWAAHEHTTYDTSGRVTAVLGQQGPITAPVTVVNQTACYNVGSAAPTCGTATANDQNRLRFVVDSVSGETATYNYDDHGTGQGSTGRLMNVIVTGGSNPRDYQYTYDAAGNRVTASVTQHVLTAGNTLSAGQRIWSTDGSTNFVMQTDGNAVLYGATGTSLFNTGTSGTGNTITLQTDGNLVVRNSGGTALWNSGTATAGAGATLTVQTDHNLVLRKANGTAAWNTATVSTAGPTKGIGTALTFNNANQLTTSGYLFDGAGNRTADPLGTATFNTAAQQTSVTRSSATTSYTYAGTNSNELLSETTPSGDTYNLTYGKADQSGLPEIEQVQADGNTAYVQHDPVTGDPLMLQTSNNVNCLYMTDIVGNPILLSTSFQTTSFAETYDPYGSATQTAGGTNGGTTDNPYLYHFGLQDRVTGDVKFGGRFYDPTTGTWTQQDTYNAPLDPSNANRYAYAADNPINVTDALGLCDFCDFLGNVLSGGLGAAAGGSFGYAAGEVIGFAIGEAADPLGGGFIGASIGAVLGGAVGATGADTDYYPGYDS